MSKVIDCAYLDCKISTTTEWQHQLCKISIKEFLKLYIYSQSNKYGYSLTAIGTPIWINITTGSESYNLKRSFDLVAHQYLHPIEQGAERTEYLGIFLIIIVSNIALM